MKPRPRRRSLSPSQVCRRVPRRRARARRPLGDQGLAAHEHELAPAPRQAGKPHARPRAPAAARPRRDPQQVQTPRPRDLLDLLHTYGADRTLGHGHWDMRTRASDTPAQHQCTVPVTHQFALESADPGAHESVRAHDLAKKRNLEAEHWRRPPGAKRADAETCPKTIRHVMSHLSNGTSQARAGLRT